LLQNQFPFVKEAKIMKKIVLIVFSVMLFALTGCDEVEDTGKYPFFTDEEGTEMLEDKYNQEVTSISVYEEDVARKTWVFKLERHPEEEYYASQHRDIEYDMVIAEAGFGGEVSGADDSITDSVVRQTVTSHVEKFKETLEGDEKEIKIRNWDSQIYVEVDTKDQAYTAFRVAEKFDAYVRENTTDPDIEFELNYVLEKNFEGKSFGYKAAEAYVYFGLEDDWDAKRQEFEAEWDNAELLIQEWEAKQAEEAAKKEK